MNLPDDCFPAYTLMHEAWYAKHNPVLREHGTGREINVAAESHGGGVAWEFAIVEKNISRGELWLHLEMFDEAWPALAAMPEVFAGLAGLGDSATVENVTELLSGLGFRDTTVRTRKG